MMRRPIAVALLAVVVATAGCGGDDYVSLRAGECLPSTAEVVGTREADPPTVACSKPHKYEVYAVTTISGPRTFPGDDAVDEQAQHACYEAFEPNVGFDPADMPSDVKVVYLQPSESSWNDQADRDVECLLIFDDDRSGSLMKGRAT